MFKQLNQSYKSVQRRIGREKGLITLKNIISKNFYEHRFLLNLSSLKIARKSSLKPIIEILMNYILHLRTVATYYA